MECLLSTHSYHYANVSIPPICRHIVERNCSMVGIGLREAAISREQG